MAVNTTTTIVGNITRDPELKYTNSGIAFATFSVAVNDKVGDREETSYFDCVAWREQGENIAESVSKGTRVVVLGHLRQRSWKTEDGSNRSRVEVVVDEIGPALRWATASVTKTPPSNNTYNNAGNNAGNNTPNKGADTSGGDGEYDPFNPF